MSPHLYHIFYGVVLECHKYHTYWCHQISSKFKSCLFLRNHKFASLIPSSKPFCQLKKKFYGRNPCHPAILTKLSLLTRWILKTLFCAACILLNFISEFHFFIFGFFFCKIWIQYLIPNVVSATYTRSWIHWKRCDDHYPLSSPGIMVIIS